MTTNLPVLYAARALMGLGSDVTVLRTDRFWIAALAIMMANLCRRWRAGMSPRCPPW